MSNPMIPGPDGRLSPVGVALHARRHAQYIAEREAEEAEEAERAARWYRSLPPAERAEVDEHRSAQELAGRWAYYHWVEKQRHKAATTVKVAVLLVLAAALFGMLTAATRAPFFGFLTAACALGALMAFTSRAVQTSPVPVARPEPAPAARPAPAAAPVAHSAQVKVVRPPATPAPAPAPRPTAPSTPQQVVTPRPPVSDIRAVTPQVRPPTPAVVASSVADAPPPRRAAQAAAGLEREARWANYDERRSRWIANFGGGGGGGLRAQQRQLLVDLYAKLVVEDAEHGIHG